MKISSIINMSICAILLTTGCKKDNDDPKNPEPPANDSEIITTCTINFIDPNGIQPNHNATFRDIDGDGSLSPVQFDTIFLHSNTIYSASITLLNETTTPVDTISNEVLEEADEHLFCFEIAGADLIVTRTDSDGTYEVGLLSSWSAGNQGIGTVTVSLKHQPGTKDGTCNPGDTDVEIAFPVIIE